MGNFYVNHTVRAPQNQVAAVLEQERRTAFVSPTIGGYTVVYDLECDQQNILAIRELGRRLSAQLQSPVVAFLNHDDDILCYWLFEMGELIEEYNSCPNYFDAEEEEEESGDGPNFMSDGEELCRVFGNPSVRARVRSILTEPDQAFALMTHRELVAALGLPACAVGAGYEYITMGDAPLDPDACLHVGRRARGRWQYDPEEDEE
jgi:hypothetical protein